MILSSDDAEKYKVTNRKLELFKKFGLFSEDVKDVTIERAISAKDLRDAYKLVYEIYLENNYIAPNSEKIRIREFEKSADMATFIARKNNEIIGVLSIIGDSPTLGLPADNAFKTELEMFREIGVKICEMTNQVVKKEYRKSAIPTELMRCAVAHGIKFGYKECIAIVSPNHKTFYELIGFYQLGNKRSYSHEINDPVIALSIDMKQTKPVMNQFNFSDIFIYNFFVENNKFLDQVEKWDIEAKNQTNIF